MSKKALKLVKDEDIVCADKMAAIIKWRKFNKRNLGIYTKTIVN